MYVFTEMMFIATQSPTADEPNHLRYGVRIARGEASKLSCTIEDSKMPVSVLNAIPRAVQQIFNPGLQKNDNGVSDVLMGRYVTLFFSLFSLALVFIWSRELYGIHAGLFSMALLAVCPNWLAHSGLVTNDAYAATIFLLVFYLLNKYCTTKRIVYFIAFCCCVGIAQIVKQTFIYLYFCIALYVISYIWLHKTKLTFRSAAFHILWLLVISLVIINTGFLFCQTGRPFNEYNFVSHFFKEVQQTLGLLGNIPLPLPSPYLIGMDTVKFFEEYGGGVPESTYPVNSILYHTEPGKSYWYYYIVSFIFKTPVPVVILIGLTTFYLARRRNRIFFLQNEWLLVFASLFFLFVMSFLSGIQLGIRHILFLYPALYILCGKLLSNEVLTKKLRALTAVCVAWSIVSVYYYFNAYLSYTNEFVTDKTNAYRLVSVANIDYGQGLGYAQEYLQQHPEVHFAPVEKSSGTFLISPGDYIDQFGMHQYQWIRQFKPAGHVHFCWLIVEVP